MADNIPRPITFIQFPIDNISYSDRRSPNRQRPCISRASAGAECLAGLSVRAPGPTEAQPPSAMRGNGPAGASDVLVVPFSRATAGLL